MSISHAMVFGFQTVIPTSPTQRRGGSMLEHPDLHSAEPRDPGAGLRLPIDMIYKRLVQVAQIVRA
jgi:hypothetical protein